MAGIQPARLALVAAMLIAGVFGHGALTLAQTGPDVGEITLFIGQAHIERRGAIVAVARGSKIQVGDTLLTADSGHIHVRFVDGGMVSVRPKSELKIEAYQFNDQNPLSSSVKFSLISGTVRSISGRAAEAAKERFRLNTPLVAIGVRGTDFVTQVVGEKVLAAVNQGAIVFSPLDPSCFAASFGPCSGARARVLSAEMRSLVEYVKDQPAPVLQALGGYRGREPLSPVVPEEINNQLKRSQIETEARTTRTAYSAPASPAAANPLAWGRWTGMALYGDLEAAPALEALKDRQALIGTRNFALFRYENMPISFGIDSGVHSFRLEKSAANYVERGVVSAASIANATLTVDFKSSAFATRFDLQSVSGAGTTLLGMGTVNNQGVFLMNAPDSRVYGAVSAGAKSAALTFEKTLLGGGTFNGVTLWTK